MGLRNLASHQRVLLLACAAVLLWAPTQASAGWYPPRPIYDYDKTPRTGNCSDPGDPTAANSRCGPLDGPVFNSFINTPSYGDERAFLDGHPASEEGAAFIADPLDVRDHTEIVVRLYVNNNANEFWGERTTATGTRVRITVPTGTRSGLRIRGYIEADNAVPTVVEDTLDLVADRPFRVEYVPGSAYLERQSGTYGLTSEIVEDRGALIGDVNMNGIFPAGFDRDAVVYARLRVIPADPPVFWNQRTFWLVALVSLLAMTIAVLLAPGKPRRLAGHYTARAKSLIMTQTFAQQLIIGVITTALIAAVVYLARLLL
ncbi:hypothetical protein [Miltoncostaea oceani]|uniref:hypothetical protein n=1 Tax=Miltoncostaea oceani TaxID=2843216 RepID=UPI001C3CB501|nr:hypothetical protein [Miltoncostaea oceani]